MITSKHIFTLTRDEPFFDIWYEAFKADGYDCDEDTVSAAFTKSDICAPFWSSDAEMTKLNEDDEQIEKYKDWIVRYYASHDDIPEGMSDGGIVGELVRCRDCVYSEDTYHDGYCYCNRPKESLQYIGNWGHYCGWALRKNHETDDRD